MLKFTQLKLNATYNPPLAPIAERHHDITNDNLIHQKRAIISGIAEGNQKIIKNNQEIQSKHMGWITGGRSIKEIQEESKSLLEDMRVLQDINDKLDKKYDKETIKAAEERVSQIEEGIKKVVYGVRR